MRKIAVIAMLSVLLIPLAVTNQSYAEESVEVKIPQGAQLVQCADTPDACYSPQNITVNVNTKVTWVNEDSATHTVTGSSNPKDSSTWGDITIDGNKFDSGFGPLMPKGKWSFTFTKAGEYPYICIVHPWMIGSVKVVEGGEEETPTPPVMKGKHIDLTISQGLPFDYTKGESIMLAFKPKEGQEHLDWKITIEKDGKQILSKDFHAHDGTLELQIMPIPGEVTVVGGEESETSGSFMVHGIFVESGQYSILAEITGVEFKPLDTPLSDNFSIDVVPEFPLTAVLPMMLALATVVAVLRLRTGRLI